MTPTEHLVAFVAMAAAIVAIVVIGTLAAADILHLGRRARGSRNSAPVMRTDPPTEPAGSKRPKELATSTVGHARTDR
jgi:hypothetical protein